MLRESLIGRGFNKNEIEQKISRLIASVTTQMLNRENHTKLDRATTILKYKQTLPDIKKQ